MNWSEQQGIAGLSLSAVCEKPNSLWLISLTSSISSSSSVVLKHILLPVLPGFDAVIQCEGPKLEKWISDYLVLSYPR